MTHGSDDDDEGRPPIVFSTKRAFVSRLSPPIVRIEEAVFLRFCETAVGPAIFRRLGPERVLFSGRRWPRGRDASATPWSGLEAEVRVATARPFGELLSKLFSTARERDTGKKEDGYPRTSRGRGLRYTEPRSS